jgi:aminoacrylate hydrolase
MRLLRISIMRVGRAASPCQPHRYLLIRACSVLSVRSRCEVEDLPMTSVSNATATAEDGCRLYYESAGRGSCVLLAAGLGGVGSFWAPVRDRLAASFRVLTFDHRGCGRSDRPEQIYTVERMAMDVVAILDHAGADRADIVGHSTGGAIAQVLALDAPDRVRRIVASGSWARPDARFKALFQNRLETLEGSGAIAYTRQAQLLGFPAPWFNGHADEFERALDHAEEALTPRSVAAARLRMLLAFDRSDDLSSVTAPVMVLAAPDDAIIPPHQSQDLAQLIGAARYEEIPGGHFFPRVDPDRYVAAVSSFLEA